MFSAVAMPSRPILIDEEPLTFEVRNLGDSSTRVLALSNPSNNATVAYKLRTTEPTLFRVRQGEGVLRPGEEVGVRITIKPLRSLEFEAVPKFQVGAHLSLVCAFDSWARTDSDTCPDHAAFRLVG